MRHVTSHMTCAAGAPAVVVFVLLSAAACSRRDAPAPAAGNSLTQGASPPGPVASPAPSGGAGPRSAHVVTMTLAKLPVEVALPSGWSVLEAQSDRETGLVALGSTEADGASAFLDGSQIVRVPASAGEATAAALARDACAKPSDCSVLGTEALPGGFLVSLRTPHAVAVESWRAGPPDHALRCGFEVSDLDSRTGRPSTWLYDPDAVARARKQGEELCRSARATP